MRTAATGWRPAPAQPGPDPPVRQTVFGRTTAPLPPGPQLGDTGQVSGRQPAKMSLGSKTLLCLWWPQIAGVTGFVPSHPSVFPFFG